MKTSTFSSCMKELKVCNIVVCVCVYSQDYSYMCYLLHPDGYNKYVEVIGGSIGAGACANVNRNAKIYKINDDTKMLHLLSEEPGGDNDWLFIVIEDIVSIVYLQVWRCMVYSLC